MAEQGWLYLLVNPSMEGLIKIGKTNRDPDNRAQELSGATGVPTPFILVYKAFVNNLSEAETYAHTLLEIKNYRVTKNREFFSAPVNVGIDAIIETKTFFESKSENIDYCATTQTFSDNSHLWEDLLELADQYYYGVGNTIQNIHEALKLYLQAYKLGSPMACLNVGDIYSKEEGLTNIQKAIAFYNEGINRGVGECYAELAVLYANSKNITNSLKCWDLYFQCEHYDKSNWKEGYYYAEYISLVKNKLIALMHKPILLDRLVIMNDFYTMRIAHSIENHLNETFTIANMDFANYILTGYCPSGQRLSGIVKRFDGNGYYQIEDERKNIWIMLPDNIIDNSSPNIGQQVEYNLIKNELNKYNPFAYNVVSV